MVWKDLCNFGLTQSVECTDTARRTRTRGTNRHRDELLHISTSCRSNAFFMNGLLKILRLMDESN